MCQSSNFSTFSPTHFVSLFFFFGDPRSSSCGSARNGLMYLFVNYIINTCDRNYISQYEWEHWHLFKSFFNALHLEHPPSFLTLHSDQVVKFFIVSSILTILPDHYVGLKYTIFTINYFGNYFRQQRLLPKYSFLSGTQFFTEFSKLYY